MNTYITTFKGSWNLLSIPKQIEKNGGRLCRIITVPYYNAWDQCTGEQYALIYQAKEEILNYEEYT